MFLKDALTSCASLHDDLAAVFTSVAAVTPGSRDAWPQLARRSAFRSALMRSLAGLCEAVDDGGPFLVQVPPKLVALRRTIHTARSRLADSNDPAILEKLATELDHAPHWELYASLLEVADPLIGRTSRLVSSEIRAARRAESTSSRSTRAKVLCRVAAR
ncbi:MAG TPA: hypothetical protein VGK20_11390 [Candidatus Binatia bacterium]